MSHEWVASRGVRNPQWWMYHDSDPEVIFSLLEIVHLPETRECRVTCLLPMSGPDLHPVEPQFADPPFVYTIPLNKLRVVVAEPEYIDATTFEDLENGRRTLIEVGYNPWAHLLRG